MAFWLELKPSGGFNQEEMNRTDGGQIKKKF
jgi:hypothetical protein